METYVPDLPVREADCTRLAELLRGRAFVALTGAGCSTESGIPDYRGLRSAPRSPVQYRQFVQSAEARRRYWARSMVGWPLMSAARPNAAHHALVQLERAGLVGIVTQNVDRLHQAAGSRRVVELHGSLGGVVCLDCGARSDRAELQRRLLLHNQAWTPPPALLAPDGDADGVSAEGFHVPGCAACGGVLKPDVVFFGENVPRAVVDAAWKLLAAAEVLLVVGSSLAVFSGYRFVRGAAERGLTVAILNAGATRGDPHAALKIEAPAGRVLPRVARRCLGKPAEFLDPS